jgi:dTDP-4-dehydrorhamnose reductase
MSLVPNILVTGAKGQLGSELEVISKSIHSLHFEFVDIDEVDLTRDDSIRSYFADRRFDFLVNTAAYTNVDHAEEEPLQAIAVNAHAVAILAQICRDRRIRMIQLSTDYVFDGKSNNPIDESEVPNPLSVYGRSKLEGENFVRSVLPDAYIIRTSWLYSSFGKNFVKTIDRLARERPYLDVIADQAGSPTYARDLGYALVSILEAIQKGRVDKPGIYHYANEGITSWYDLACAVVRYNDLPCTIRPITTKEFPSQVTRPGYSVLAKCKIKDTFGLTIPNWYDSLLLCMKELKSI